MCDLRERVDGVREKLEKLVARTSSSLGSRIDRVRKDGVQNKEDIAAVRFEVSRAKANSRKVRERKFGERGSLVYLGTFVKLIPMLPQLSFTDAFHSL